VIRSTHGAANLTAQGFADLAGRVSQTAAVDDDLIQAGENVLATFTNVRNEAGRGNDIFNQATMAATDLAAAMGHGQVTAEGLQSANIQLGKALNDPIKGITALQRVGVTFTAQQRQQIKTLVASGDRLGAQRIILAELRKEFGGSAAAGATSAKRLQVAWGNAQETLGNLLIPAIETGSRVLSGLIGWMDRNRGATAALGGVVATITGVLLAQAAAEKVVAATQAVVRGATLAWRGAQLALNLALAANPIGLVVVGVGALVAAFILAYRHSARFRAIVQTAFGTALRAGQATWNWIRGNWPKLLQIIAGPIGTAIVLIIRNWSRLRASVAAVIATIVRLIRGWFNANASFIIGTLRLFGRLPGPLGAPFRAAARSAEQARDRINGQMDRIQRRIDRIRSPKPVQVKAVATATVSRQTVAWLRTAHVKVPQLARGGKVTVGTTPTADDVLARLSKGETIVSARDSARPEFIAWAKQRRIPGFQAGGIVGVPRVIAADAAALRKYAQHGVDFLARAIGRGLGRVLDERLAPPRLAFPAGITGPVGRSVNRVAQETARLLRRFGEWPSWARRIMFESGGNWRAVNRWDSNWRAGHPSVGGAQVIAGTFRAYAGPFRNVGPFLYGVSVDPLANSYAGGNYAVHRYGSLRAVDPRVRPRGYAAGGIVTEPTLALVGERGPEAITPLARGRDVIDYDRLADALARQPIIIRVSDVEIARANRTGSARLGRR
jgi:hypothetical protein